MTRDFRPRSLGRGEGTEISEQRWCSDTSFSKCGRVEGLDEADARGRGSAQSQN